MRNFLTKSRYHEHQRIEDKGWDIHTSNFTLPLPLYRLLGEVEVRILLLFTLLQPYPQMNACRSHCPMSHIYRTTS
jgi:hypothetical protein